MAKTVRVYFLRDGKVGPVGRTLGTGHARDASRRSRRPGRPRRSARSGSTRARRREKLAATVYTLSQFDPAQPVVVDGKSYRRSDFEELTPAILVEGPLPFAAVSAPLRLWGTANTFEATFEYDLLDPAGKVLSHHFVTATSGSGTRGTYDVTIPFEAPERSREARGLRALGRGRVEDPRGRDPADAGEELRVSPFGYRERQRSYVTSPLSTATPSINSRPSRSISCATPVVPFTVTVRPRRKSREPRPS